MKNINYIIIGIVILTILLLSVMNKTKKLSGAEFIKVYNNTQNAVLIDVRTPSEFATGHIDKAININFESPSFASEVSKLDPSKVYFVYCRSGNRSEQAISVMKSNGIKNIYELSGGLIYNEDSIKFATKLTEKEKLGLIQMREEEKLAHDVYVTLFQIWGVKIFSNISASEQTHTDAVKVLLEGYDIKDPVVNYDVGQFASKDIQDLYNKFVSQGKISLNEAFIVGATIEDLDIRDLEILKNETDKDDIIITYNNLQKGSRNHMRSFVKNLENRGGSYIPKYISDADYKNIISGTQERGYSDIN